MQVEMVAAPRGQEMERARGSLEFLGRWNDKRDDRAMAVKLSVYQRKDTNTAKIDTVNMVRVALGRLVDELVRTNASSGILAISYFSEIRGTDNNRRRVTVWGFSWSASPDDTSYQRHGSVAGTASTKYGRYGVYGRRGGGDQTMHENIRFADFEGAIDTLGSDHKSAVYRVTLPSGGLDRSKWAGRPPPPAHDHERPPDEWLRRWHVVSRSWLRRRRRCLREEDRLAAVYRNKT